MFIKSQVIQFVKDCDKEYTFAFSQKMPGALSTSFSNEAIEKIYEYMCDEKNIRYYGDDTFRKTKWSIVSRDKNNWVLQKEVNYDKLYLRKGLVLDIGFNFIERWFVTKRNKFIVEDVEIV